VLVAMPEVQFEIIRLEDIGKDILKPAKQQSQGRSPAKLSSTDVEKLKHYLNRHHHDCSKSHVSLDSLSISVSKTKAPTSLNPLKYVDITDDFYSSKEYADLCPPSDSSQPLADIFCYHHHYRRQQHHHTKPTHENTSQPVPVPIEPSFLLDFATCGMKKNTRLPVPNENFSLSNGCFGDDAGFTMEHHQKNFFGKSSSSGRRSLEVR
jgi:hypothetical protein